MQEKINCPNCGYKFDVEQAISGQLEKHFREEYEKKNAAIAIRVRIEKDRLKKEELRLQEEKNQQSERIKEETEKAVILERERIKTTFQNLQSEKEKLELSKREQEKYIQSQAEKVLLLERVKIEARYKEQFAERIRSQEEELNARKKENQELKGKELTLLKKERELQEKSEDLNLHLEKEMLIRQTAIEEKARQKERESFELEKLKLLKQIDDNKKLAEEMKRKAEQGSMQLQGEIQELAIEELLQNSFPFDQIQEIPKGIRGADCILKVINSYQQGCGTIVFESKRTKAFANDWIEKLKQDQLSCKADLAVIVTETMPNGMDRFGERDGVWICGFQEVVSLTSVLRALLIQVHTTKMTEVNKGDKMELLYTYLTSNEFVQTVTRIAENYSGMRKQLESERRAMSKIWAQREKQIWVVEENIASLFGSIQGIAGKELPSSAALELPSLDEEEEYS